MNMTGRIHFDNVLDFAKCVGVDLKKAINDWFDFHGTAHGTERDLTMRYIERNDHIYVRDNFYKKVLHRLIENGSLLETDKAVVELQSDGGVDIVITYTKSEVRHTLDPENKNVFYDR